MSLITTTLDVNSVNYEESFTCTIDVSLSSLDEKMTSAYVKLFIPDFINFDTSHVQKPIAEIQQEKTDGGTNVIFNFGTNISDGISTQIEITGQFKLDTSPDEIYVPQPQLYINDEFVTEPIDKSSVNLKVKTNFQLSRKIVLPEINPAAGGEVYFCVTLENLGDLGGGLEDIVIRIPAPASPEGIIISPTYTPEGFDNSPSMFKDISQDGNIATINNNELVFNLASYKGTKYSFFYKIILPENLTEGDQIVSMAYWSHGENDVEDMDVNSFTISENIYDAAVVSYGPSYTIQNELFNYTHNVTNTGNQILNNVYMKAELDDSIKYTDIKTGSFQLMGIEEIINNMKYYIDFSTINKETGRLGPFSSQISETVNLSNHIASDDNLSTLTWEFDNFGVGVETKAPFEINGIVRENDELDSRITNHFEITWPENEEDQVKSTNVITEIDNLCVLYPAASRLTKDKVIPGDIIRYKIGANCIESRLENPILAMFLPSQLTYVGNEKFSDTDYFTGVAEGLENPTIEVIENFNNTDQTLVKFIYDYAFNQKATFDIEFDAKVKVGATGEIETQLMLNSINNTGKVGEFDDIYEGDLGEKSIDTPYVLSNIIRNKVELFASINFDTKVKGELDEDFINEFGIATTPEAGSVEYTTILSNIGNANFTSIEIVNILPHIGDKGVIQVSTSRGSEFAVYNVNEIVTDNSTIMYSQSLNPRRFGADLKMIGSDDDWTETLPSEATSVKSFKLVKNTVLKPGETIEFKIYATTPSGVPLNSVAYNSFAVKMEYEDEDGNRRFLLPIETPKTGVKVVPSEEGTAKISGRVWLASSENEVYDDSKIGINDVGIVLFDEEGRVVSKDFSTNNFEGQNSGIYTFANIPIGKYQMKIYIDTLEYIVLPQEGINQGGITPLISVNEDMTINIALKIRKKINSVLDINTSARDMLRNVLYSQIVTQMKLEDIMNMMP